MTTSTTRVRWGFYLAMAATDAVVGCAASSGPVGVLFGFLAAYLLGMALAARRLTQPQSMLVFRIADDYAIGKDPVN